MVSAEELTMPRYAFPISPSQMGARLHATYPSRMQMLRPCVLGFLGLGLAVFLWGFSWKLSRYDNHRKASTRDSVAKMWIEPRSTPVAAVLKFRVKPHLGTHLIVSGFAVGAPRFDRAVETIFRRSRPRIQLLALPLSLRSPPQRRFDWL